MFKPYLSKEIALEKIKKYCAYQERTHKEVREKLKSIQCHYREIDEIIVALIEEDFLNEERFAITYARGKFRMKSWGKQKIKYALKMKGISEYCIKKGLAQIPEEEYLCTLKHLFQKNTEKYKEQGLNPFETKFKVSQYLIGRGFEHALIEQVSKQVEE